MIPTARSLASRMYRAAMAPLGRRALARMLADGLPPRLAPALRFLFTGDLPEDARRTATRIEDLRERIARRPGSYRFAYTPSPLGMARWLVRAEQTSDGDVVTGRFIAQRMSVVPRWGMFLHLVADGLAPRTILEMGACAGISGAYLATARSRPRLVTIDASAPLAEMARETLAAVTDQATVINEPFGRGLPRALDLLSGEKRPIDLAYIDGHHDEEATKQYVRDVLPSLAKDGVIILDDIRLYAEMWRAWNAVMSTPGVVATVNTGRFGLLWMGEGATRAAHYDLTRYTGWWTVGASRKQSFAR